MRIQTYTEEWGSSVFRNALAGLTSSFALVPECIAFALVAHLNPLMGLYGAFIICALTAILGGRPGMISGAAGSMAVVIVALVVEHGVQYLLATVVLAGALMMLFGLLRLGKLIRMVPHPVMIGFVNGLAIIIALAQLEQFKRATPQGNVWLQGMPLLVMCGLVALTIVVVYAVPRVTKAAPPALVAIIGIGLLSQFAGLNTRTLGDMAHIAGGFPSLRLPLVPLDLGTLKIVFPYAVLTAIVGLLETLLTFNLTEELTGTLGRPNRECIALGIANVVSGCFGGMGGCAMIGQTVINLSSGGRSRVSGTTSGIMILLFILFLSPLIERIPLAALVGVMLVVAQQTFSWGSLRLWGKVPRGDALVVLSVTLITIFTDLAIAVLFGVIISALHFSWKHARSIRAETFDQREGERTYVLYGTLFFASTANFQNIFKPQSDPQTVIVDCKQLKVVDHSAIAAFEALKARYQKAGTRLQFVHLSPHCQHILRRAGVAIMADAN